MFRKTFAAALAATTIAGSAFAADLPSRKAEPVYAAPVFTWTGFYLGVNVGAGWNGGTNGSGSMNFLGIGSNGAPIGVGVPGPTSAWTNGQNSQIGVLGGLTAGYNLQVAPLYVVGLEADIQAASIRRNGTAGTFVPVGVNGIIAHTPIVASATKTDWFGTLRGRVGVTPFTPNFLIYGTGGLAYGNAKSAYVANDFYAIAVLAGAATASSTKFGWTAGAGVEWGFTQNLSLKAKWLYVDLGRTTLSGVNSVELVGPAPFPLYSVTQSYRNDFHVLRVGLNYRFGGLGAGPVVAKY